MGDTYQVQSGDNLWKIVKNAFNLTDANQINAKVKEIATLNKIKNLNSVWVGQKLNLGETSQEVSSKPLPETATRTFDIVNSSSEFNPTAEQLEAFTKKKPAEQNVKPSTAPAPAAESEPAAQNKSEITDGAFDWNSMQNSFMPEVLKENSKPAVSTPLRHVETPTEQNQSPAAGASAQAEVPETVVSVPENEPAAAAPSASTPANEQIKNQGYGSEFWNLKPQEFMPDTLKNDKKEKSVQVPLEKGVSPDELAALNKPAPPQVKPRKISLSQYAQIPVTTKFDGTAEDIEQHLGGVLKGQGEKFIELQEKYGINAAFLAGIVMNESSNGTSKLALSKNNVGGVRIPGRRTFKTYEEVGDCIEHMAKFLSANYIQQGRTTIGAIGAKYCPVTDDTDTQNLNQYWYRNVGYNMAKIDPQITRTV